MSQNHATDNRRKLSLRKRLVFVVTANLLVFAALAILGEAACRLFSTPSGQESLPDWMLQMLQYSDDMHLGWELRPDVLDHNPAGYRGDQYAEEKRPGVRRIAMIGDSVVYGLHVDANEAFPQLLQEKLNAGDASHVEVLNFGVPGYSTFQEYTQLKTRVLPLNPDLVILTLSRDDAETSPVVINVGGEMTLFRNELEGVGLLNNPVHWAAFRHSYLYRFLYKHLAVSAEMIGAGTGEDPVAQWQNVLRSAELCRSRGIDFMVVFSPALLPYESSDDPAAAEGHRLLQRCFEQMLDLAAQSGIDHVNLGPLYDQRVGQLKIRPSDHDHLNPAGHRLVADKLFEKLTSPKATALQP